jgi:nucleotide-binding universal stress UspA family protein
MLKDVVVYLDSSPARLAQVELAFDIAQANESHVTVVSSISGSDPDDLRELFADGASSLQVAATWLGSDQGAQADPLLHARCADLLILGQPASKSSAAMISPSAAVLGCGCPVVVVPFIGRGEHTGQRILAAFNGSREASRAINDALPLLSQAKAVTLLSVDPGESGISRLEAEKSHLECHAVPVRTETISSGDVVVSDIILSRAADVGADLIVMGAYSHSRLREAIVGGVTRDLLRQMTVPIFMSH